jgi:pyridoxamine 5'-phosphate oxidase
MALITASADGVPSGRMVLLKEIDSDGGFRFYTNHQSRKAVELSENPRAQLLFYWPTLGRQIRIEGRVARVPDPDSDAYWSSRPRGSQIGGLVSRQSRPLPSLEEMETRVAEATREYEGREIPRPKNWGGFSLRPNYFEFWRDRESRLHERVVYELEKGAWKTGRLWP